MPDVQEALSSRPSVDPLWRGAALKALSIASFHLLFSISVKCPQGRDEGAEAASVTWPRARS